MEWIGVIIVAALIAARLIFTIYTACQDSVSIDDENPVPVPKELNILIDPNMDIYDPEDMSQAYLCKF